MQKKQKQKTENRIFRTAPSLPPPEQHRLTKVVEEEEDSETDIT